MATLADLRGKDTVARWQAMARGGQWAEVFNELMLQHYDPLYLRSMTRNFAGMAVAQQLALRDGHVSAMRDGAARLLAG
jgi:tRNA 2-selenouridine synthase